MGRRAFRRWFARGADFISCSQPTASLADSEAAAFVGLGSARRAQKEPARHPEPGQPALARLAKIEVTDYVTYLFAADVIGTILAAAIIFRVYAVPLDYDQKQLWLGLAGFILAWTFSASMQKLYAGKALLAGFPRLVLRAVATCAATFGIILLLAFSLNIIGGVSRVWLLSWALSVFVWVSFCRLVWWVHVRRLLRRGVCLDRALVLASSPYEAASLSRTLARESGGHLGVVGAHALPGLLGGPSLEWVDAAARSGDVDRIIVGRFSGAMAEANALLARLARVSIDVTVLPDLDRLQRPVLNVDRIGMLPAIDLDFQPLSKASQRIKRAEDLILAGLITIFVAPVLLIAAIAVKLDSPGPVLFRQKRAGFNDRTFEVWKFRTMFTHSCDAHALRQTSRNDPRVTRVGRFLRATSMDELPQLFNVLRGHMSIVGPRPHALGMTAAGLPLREVIEGYSARHRLKPGITGWAQVNGSRGEVDTQEKLRRRVALDCDYIERWSLGLDLWIILRTAAMLVMDRNAY